MTMKRSGLILLVIGIAGIVGLAFFFTSAGEDPAAIIARARELGDAEKYDESNKLLLDLNRSDPENADVYWRIAENYYNIAERQPKEAKDKKMEYYIKTEEWARRGIEVDPALAENYFWVAVGISQQAVVRGIAKSLSLVDDIEEMYLKTLEMNPTFVHEDDSTEGNAHLALCIFYRKVPEWRIMSLLFGTRGDMDKAVEHCREAVRIHPTRLEYVKELGMALTCRGMRRDQAGDIEEGKKWLRQVTEMKPEDQLDVIDRNDAAEVMEHPDMACGYSRIQQEEVSKDQVKKE
jgi:tetratricopeptide (TPR) repeat protein